MAIKIIKPGKRHFFKECPQCECSFEYDPVDRHFSPLIGWYVECPCCGKLVSHNIEEDPTDG